MPRWWGISVGNPGSLGMGRGDIKAVWTSYGGNRMAPLNILREREADGSS